MMHYRKMPTLADVDGTVPGRAVQLIVNVDDPDSRTGVMHNASVEGEYGCTDPHGDCQELWTATKDDWPNHVMTTIGNPRADYLEWRRRHRDGTPPRFLEFLAEQQKAWVRDAARAALRSTE